VGQGLGRGAVPSAVVGAGRDHAGREHHGRAGGGFDGRGNTPRPIRGPRLDGTSGFAAIKDSDGGRLDGDPQFDRAVGPMQFIPSTWVRWAYDGDGDGIASPDNIYDVAGAAAAYLCHGRSDVTGDAALISAFLSYNHSDVYAHTVLDFAHGYERSVTLPS
jgi:membrane-bound lytic murein transglycosylase B